MLDEEDDFVANVTKKYLFHLNCVCWYITLAVGRRGRNKKVEKGTRSKSTTYALF